MSIQIQPKSTTVKTEQLTRMLRDSNFNCPIAATTGAGKSFGLVQMVLSGLPDRKRPIDARVSQNSTAQPVDMATQEQL